MSDWPSTRAKHVLNALLRMGYRVDRQRGSHRTLKMEGRKPYTWAWADGDELGTRILNRVERETGLTPDDL